MKHVKLFLVVIVVIAIMWFSLQLGEETITQLPVLAEELTQEELLLQEKDSLIAKVDLLVENKSISAAVVESCMEITEDYKLCIKNVLWVSNAESTMFKNWMYPSNNGFWWMHQWKKRRFSSIEECIYKRVEMYQRNWWYSRTTWEAWLKWKYCTSWCTYRISNYNSAIDRLSLD